MLYLSLILILLGVVILLYSVSVEVRKFSRGDRDFGGPRDSGRRLAESQERSQESGAHAITSGMKADSGAPAGSMEAMVVFYEDRSNLVDYHNATGTIDLDPAMTEYKKINRIGAGSLVYEKHGMSFYMENRLYRFDFHRFEDFATGDNFIAIRLKGGKSAKLFIVERNSPIIAGIAENYRNYLR